MRFQSHYIDRGHKIWEFSFVHCGEVFNTVSFYRRVIFERFHCIGVQLLFDDKFGSVLKCIGKPKVSVGGGEWAWLSC